MSKEPIIQDKIHLLMEETGCDQGEAELAMTSAGYDLEKAVRTIGVLLRNIVAVKGKFLLPSRNLYGLVILIANTKNHSIFRIRSVVSYNPSLYETPLREGWYEFEKTLYAFRLSEGTLQQVTQDLERVLWQRLGKHVVPHFYDIIRESDETQIHHIFQKIILGYFSDNTLNLEIVGEELNLQQFKHLKPRGEDIVPVSRPYHSTGHGALDNSENLLLSVKLQEEPDGIMAKDVVAGDSVYAILTDNRDIAQYLSKLLGGRDKNGLAPILAPVEEIRREGDKLYFQVRLSTGVLGMGEASADCLLLVHKHLTPRWWQRFVPFLTRMSRK